MTRANALGMNRVKESKLARELTIGDIGKKIFGHHGARGLVSDKRMPTWNTIQEFTVERHGVTVKVARGRYESAQTFYGEGERIELLTIS